MTAPAPGFPPELETAITEALLGHQWANMGPDQNNACECGTPLDMKSYSNEDCWNAFCSHQAAVVMEVIAQHTTTEWGVDYLDGSYDLHEDQRMAEDFAGGGTVVSRLVLPWQEVKA